MVPVLSSLQNKCRMLSVQRFWISVKKKMKKLFFTRRDGGEPGFSFIHAHVKGVPAVSTVMSRMLFVSSRGKKLSVSLLPWEEVGDAVSEVVPWERVSEVLDQEFCSLRETQLRTWYLSPMVDAVWGVTKLVAYLLFVPTNSNPLKHHYAARTWLLHVLDTFKEIMTNFEEISKHSGREFQERKMMMLFAEIAVLHICKLFILNNDVENLEFKAFFEKRFQESLEDDLVGVDRPMHSREGYIAVVQSILKIISTSCRTLIASSKLDCVWELVEQWLCDYKHVEQWCSELHNQSSMSQAQTSMDELQIMCSHAHEVIIAIEVRRMSGQMN